MTHARKSRAAVLREYGKPVAVEEFTVPEVGDDSLVVRIEVSTMCGTDVHIVQGEIAHVARLPVILGHEIVGRIAALGRNRKLDVTGAPLKEGDLIAWSYAWCGRCYWCTVARQPTLCVAARMYGWGPATEFPFVTGGFAEYAYVLPECQVVKVPQSLDPALAASATCALRTVMHGFERIGRVASSETVVVQGTGPIGLYSVAMARGAGAHRVIAIGAPKNRLDLARDWGADDVISIEDTPESRERVEIVRRLTEGRGADLVVEASGAAVAFPEGIDLVRRGGRYLVIGQAEPKPVSVYGTHFNIKMLSVIGVLSGEIRHYHAALHFLADNAERLPLKKLLGNRYPLSGVNDALRAMKTMAEVKPVIVPAG